MVIVGKLLAFANRRSALIAAQVFSVFLLFRNVQAFPGQPPDLAVPEQVHLSLAPKPNAMTITWATPIALKEAPLVEFGKSDRELSRKQIGTTRKWAYNGINRFTHTANLEDLDYDSTYYYQVGCNEQGWSHLFHFRTFPEGNQFPIKICVFGDLGYVNGTAMPYLQRAVQRQEFDLVIHVGDIAYDLHTENGNRGDLFLRQIEPIAAYVPYMVVAGNHEEDGMNFTNYIERFRMPNSPFNDNQVYSIDVGPVHLLAISTEYHGFFYKYGFHPVLAQNSWLKHDIEKANANRAKVPWIISYQHRPFYCSNQNSYECKAFENQLIRTGYESLPGFEKLLADGGVDLGFWGHEHSYERFWPVSQRRVYNLTADPYHNAAAPIYFVTGSAGCHSGHAWFEENAIPASAKQLNDYGYTILHVLNHTHLHIDQISVENGLRVVDSVWISKELGHIPNTKFADSQPFIAFPDYVDDTGRDLRNCDSRDPMCMVQKQKYKFNRKDLDMMRREERP